ncbi:MAG: hypothetical protein KDI74_09020 [Gammaproteobacteria bacterium]|nr:hypothetical protein [Gammaproteobacteria bacterium]HXK55835.1 V-type ATP synthase subunit E family protein [Gammaproteobacteria bacterium]
MDQVNELELAILERANRMANECRERAEHSRDNILHDAGERIRLREEREVLLAKAKSERAYRRIVQAHELQLQKEMDHLRWNLVEGVREQLAQRMRSFAQQEREQYRQLLQKLLVSGAQAIERDALVAEVNRRDLDWLQPIWGDFSAAAAAGKRIALASVPIHTLGGILIRSEDNRIRVDNTFEGRMERLGRQLHQTIIERLLPNGAQS